MTETPHLKLPYLMPAQAMKHLTHNQALQLLDVLTQIAVLDRDLSAPPVSPAEGDRYIVGPGASGDWLGHEDQLAVSFDGEWVFLVPEIGWQVFLVDELGLVAWTGSAWEVCVGLGGSVDMLGVNTVPDSTNRLAVKADAVLLNHDDVTPGSGDLRAVLNKSLVGKTASLLFQTGASGRAEIGTTGDDKLHFKVSPNGVSWSEAMVVDSTTGFVGVGVVPAGIRLELYGTSTVAAQIKSRAEFTSPAGGGGLSLQHNNNAGGLPLTNDRLGYVLFGTTDAGTNRNGGGLAAFADGNYSATSLPTRFAFETAPAGSTTRLERMRIDAEGRVGIGTPTPAVRLDVDGPVRVKSYTVAGLPAANLGAGQLVFVSNETGGATPAFSDGTNWRRVADRAVVS